MKQAKTTHVWKNTAAAKIESLNSELLCAIEIPTPPLLPSYTLTGDHLSSFCFEIIEHRFSLTASPRSRSIMDVDPRHYEQIAIKDSDIHNIVLSYLVHNCYKETVESFATSTGMKQPADYLEDMEKRKRIFHCALEGDALKAIELTEEMAKDLIEDNKDLHFDLLSLHFVELVCGRKCTEALEFAQTKLTPFGKVQKFVKKLEDFMALLAYEEPETSPMFHLLGLEYRQHVADNLNRALLAHANLPNYTAMERLIQQATVVRQCLHQDSGKDGLPPFSLKDFLKG